MCSFSEGWKTELPCSSARLARKDYVVPAELWAKIAASSVRKRTVLLPDFGGLSRREMLWVFIYKINNRVAFCWKAPSYPGRNERGRQRRKTWKAGKTKDIQLKFCGGKCPFLQVCLTPLRCLGLLLPFVIFPASPARGDVPAESVSEGRLSARICCCLVTRESRQSSYRKTGRAVAGFAGIALIPAQTRLKSSCLWDDCWEPHQPKGVRGFQRPCEFGV